MQILKTILLVEDDYKFAYMLCPFLEQEGYKVKWIDNGTDAIKQIDEISPDLIILDMLLPDVDGIEVCKRLRLVYQHPILMLTAKVDEVLEVSAIETGVDIFLKKPVRTNILLAHIKSLFRRSQIFSELAVKEKPYEVAVQDLLINSRTLSLRKNGVNISLTSGEFEVLNILVLHLGMPVSRDTLFSKLKGVEYDAVDRSIDLRISSLRKKLNDEERPYRYIKTIRGKGYQLVIK